MPFYEYRCDSCGHQDSFLESMKTAQVKTCPECKKRRGFKRLISASGFQLKGQGWYATDFKDKPKPPPSNKEGKENKENKEGKEGKENKIAKNDKDTAADKKTEKSDSTSPKKATASESPKTDKKTD